MWVLSHTRADLLGPSTLCPKCPPSRGALTPSGSLQCLPRLLASPAAPRPQAGSLSCPGGETRQTPDKGLVARLPADSLASKGPPPLPAHRHLK